MIHIFNRREIAITYDMKRQYEIRTKLEENQIDYVVKVTSNFGPDRSRVGIFGAGQMDEYIIYVHKDDYEKAVYVINRC